MCEWCEQPGVDREAHLGQVRRRAAQNRWTVVSVKGSVTRSEVSYTVGLTSARLPELVVLGVRRPEAVKLLDLWARYLLDKSLVLPGETSECGPFLMETVEVDAPQEHLHVAAALFGDQVRALPLVWADGRGRWPWEPGFSARRAGQPVLGRRAPHFCEEHRRDRLDVPEHL